MIILDKNYRQTDEAWSQSLLRWRINQPLLADIEAVNSRFMDSSNSNLKIIVLNRLNSNCIFCCFP